MARLVRGQVLVVRRLDYVHAARAFGASDARLAARHVLPNVLGPVIVAATLGVGGAIMAEAALSFVGLGAPPPTPSWGAMVAEGRDLLRVAPWVSLFPGLAIRSEEHTSELQSQSNLVCRLLLEKKKKNTFIKIMSQNETKQSLCE